MVRVRFANAVMLAIVGLCASSVTIAAVLLDNATLVAKAEKYAQVAPPSRSFTVTGKGRYRVTATDIGFPGPLTGVDLIVTKGAEITTRLTRFGMQEFDAVPGTYQVQVLGYATSAGTVGVVVESTTGVTPLLAYQSGVVSNPSAVAANRTSLAAKFSVSTPGSYQVAVTDRRFPTALTSFDLIILSASGVPVARVCQPAIPSVCDGAPRTFAATNGDYDVLVNAVAASPLQAGLYSVKISPAAGGTSLYSVTQPVGVLESHAFVEFPAAGQYALTLNDLQFPTSLAKVSAMLTQGSEVLTTVNGAVTQAFAANAGTATLYTMAEPAAQGVGTFGVTIPNGTQSLYSDAQAVVGSANGARAYVFVGSFPNAGQYRIQARDFGFPTTIPSLQLLVTQDGAPLGAVNLGGSLTVQAKSGQFMLVAIADMQSATATGLFGVLVDAQPSGNELLSIAQGVGDLFHTQPLVVSSTGGLDVTLNDLGFPAPFADLALVVTRGNTLVGQIFGGGTFSLAATPGTYSLNFIARSKTTDNYGLYGLTVEDSPPPTVTFSAAAGSVPQQGSTTVSWSSTGASTCTGSGGWTGVRATSGTNVTVGPFAADTTLTLTCNGPGGSKAADVRISVVQTADKSGGGSMALWQLLAMALLLALRVTGPIALRDSRRFR